MAKQPQNTTVYKFYSSTGNELHCGRTRRPLHKRESEHRRNFVEPDGYAEAVVDGLTWEEAGAWERQNRCSPYDRANEDEDDRSKHGLAGWLAVGAAVVGGLWLWGRRTRR